MFRGLMVSDSMAVQEECGGSGSNTLLPASSGISLNSGLHAVVTAGNDYSPKVRKPYTITKQRERWTEEEHKKFLEALKLYGRAWRRIEEHVGSKTAVQIRSHAQKFFSKVVRESGGSTTCSVEPIEIPPPRPKRKPMHPYPRKMIHSLNKESTSSERHLRSPSPNLSILEQEDQSPTSVLSAVGSDALCSTDSNTINRSLSPVSRAGGVHPADFTLSEPNSTTEDNGQVSPVPISASDEQLSKVRKLDLFPKESAHSVDLFPKESAHSEDVRTDKTSTRSLKLFGRTVLITECQKPSPPSVETAKLLPLDISEGKLAQPLPWNLSASRENPWGHFSHEPHAVLYNMQFVKNSNTVETGSGTHTWWSAYGATPFPSIPFRKQENLKASSALNGEEVEDKETQKEGSWTGSNSGSVNDDADRNVESETQTSRPSYQKKELYRGFELTSASLDLSVGSYKCGKGFVPYRKRMAERDSQSSTVTGEERDQRIRLCL